jgi:hypothetical protein
LADGSSAGGGLFSEGFVAPQAGVSTFSLVAPSLVKEFPAALPVRVPQQAAGPALTI